VSVLIADMARFGRRLIQSGDIDPAYPVLKHLYQARSLDLEQALWQTAVYVAFYHLPSALAFYREHPSPGRITDADAPFPCGIERRGLRGGKVVRHLNHLSNEFRVFGIAQWITQGWGTDPRQNFRVFTKQAMGLWNNGRWAAFKWAELLKKVHRLPLDAPDMCLEHCSGPREGLLMAYGLPETTTTQRLNEQAMLLRCDLAHNHNLHIADWEELETLLCNWHSYRLGKYEIGHDIHEMYTVTEKARREGWLVDQDHQAIFEARAKSFATRWLKERS
jgi:hypothetical protein